MTIQCKIRQLNLSKLATILIYILFVGWVGGVSADSAPSSSSNFIYTVNSTDDTTDGFCNVSHCSLREAINAANFNAGADTIRFDFSSAVGILPNSPLPDITEQVTIDGVTGNPSTCPTASNPADLLITLSGFSAGANADGLVLAAGSDGSIIKGLNFVLWSDRGITMSSNNNDIVCNHIGIPNLDVDGFGNLGGIVDNGDNNWIGGNAIADRNVISGNDESGILLNYNSDNAVVRYNLVGTSRDGTSAIPNRWGIYIYGDGGTIGSATASAGNVFSGNSTHGIHLDGDGNGAENNLFTENKVGTDVNGTAAVPNGDGISIRRGATNNTIGSVANPMIIAFNTSEGIQLFADNTLDNEIRGNSIHSNGGLGIDFNEDGVTINDSGDGDPGPNNLKNHPILSSAENTGRIVGTLPTQNSLHTIDVYQNDSCDNSDWGEGQTWLASFTGTPSGGILSFDTVLPNLPTVGKFLTATATDPDGNTSEFGNCVEVTEKIFVVNTIGGSDATSGDGVCDVDGGTLGEQCTLIGVINEVNALTGNHPYTINFDFPDGLYLNVTGGGLPTIIKPVILDGSSNPDSSCPTADDPATLTVTLDGSGLDPNTHIIHLGSGSDGSEIRGFAIVDGVSDGILINSDNNVIACNHIGILTDGTTARGNADDGVQIAGGVNNRIGAFNLVADRNVISGNGGSGVQLSNAADDNKVRGNYIGTNADGTAAVANNNGIFLLGATTNSVIGGNTATRRNVIAGNTTHGINITDGSGSTTVLGNYIGIGADGATDIGNGGVGVRVENSGGVTIGGDDANERNVIGSNGSHGVLLLASGSSTISANYIGTGATGNVVRGNDGAGVRNEEGDSVTIGGATSAEGNIIAGNGGSGIYLTDGTVVIDIMNNEIGRLQNGSDGGNILHGLHIDALSSQVSVSDNIIAYNGRNGIRVDDSAIFGEFLSNRIFTNGWIGIDLGEDSSNPTNGVTLNDTGDGDSGANRLQNFPIITGADGSSGEVTMTLNSVANNTYTIQLFRNQACDTAGHGEGQQLLAEFDVNTDSNGDSGGTMTFAGFNPGEFLTATATRHYTGAPGETSEFSACFEATGAPPTAIALQEQQTGNPIPLTFLFIGLLTLVSLPLWQSAVARKQ